MATPFVCYTRKRPDLKVNEIVRALGASIIATLLFGLTNLFILIPMGMGSGWYVGVDCILSVAIAVIIMGYLVKSKEVAFVRYTIAGLLRGIVVFFLFAMFNIGTGAWAGIVQETNGTDRKSVV